MYKYFSNIFIISEIKKTKESIIKIYHVYFDDEIN